jgi:hypothetical protein
VHELAVAIYGTGILVGSHLQRNHHMQCAAVGQCSRNLEQ